MDSTSLSDSDREHLERALALAERGRGAVSPNPMVGCVIAGDGWTVEGWHAEYGGLHAETAALEAARAAGYDPAGATAYVTLEPCAHHGRQPPCSGALVAAGVARVVAASDDPSEKTSGKGPAQLEAAGIGVEWADGDLRQRAALLNQPFRKHARTGRPWVFLKSASSLDGRTAAAGGDSKWISSEPSRELVHHWRAAADAIAVGIGTALADDPLLTARGVGATSQPLRVIFDSHARLPVDSRLVRSVEEAPVLLLVGADASPAAVDALSRAGVEVMVVAGEGADRVPRALEQLGRRGVTSLMLEGGATLAGSFADAGELDELRLFLAPLLIGGSEAAPLVAGRGAPTIAEAGRALAFEWEGSGQDLLLRARMREW